MINAKDLEQVKKNVDQMKIKSDHYENKIIVFGICLKTRIIVRAFIILLLSFMLSVVFRDRRKWQIWGKKKKEKCIE